MFLTQDGIIKCKREEIRPTILPKGGELTFTIWLNAHMGVSGAKL